MTEDTNVDCITYVQRMLEEKKASIQPETEKLKACPFCGEAVVMCKPDQYNYYIHCETCGVEMWRANPRRLLESWNSRKLPNPFRRMRER